MLDFITICRHCHGTGYVPTAVTTTLTICDVCDDGRRVSLKVALASTGRATPPDAPVPAEGE